MLGFLGSSSCRYPDGSYETAELKELIFRHSSQFPVDATVAVSTEDHGIVSLILAPITGHVVTVEVTTGGTEEAFAHRGISPMVRCGGSRVVKEAEWKQ